MKTGDPKQAAILSIVAVGAVGFLFSQLRGKGAGPLAATSRVAANESASTAGDSPELPSSLYGDPFNHPILIKMAIAAKQGDKPKSQDPPKKEIHIPPLTLGPFGSVMGTGEDDVLPDPSDASEKKGGEKRQPSTPDAQQAAQAPPKPPALHLSAIVSATHAVALMRVGDGSTQEFLPGQKMADGVVLQSIAEDHVVISFGHKTFSIHVGSTLQP